MHGPDYEHHILYISLHYNDQSVKEIWLCNCSVDLFWEIYDTHIIHHLEKIQIFEAK
jgi:hypothetical protein